MSRLAPTEFFSLDRPCGNCPFRTDKPAFGLRRERATEIANALRRGETFVCHKTVDYSEREDGGPGAGQERSRMCAGARATLSPTMVDAEQLASRMYEMGLSPDPVPDLEPDLPVAEDLDSWIDYTSQR